MCGNLVQNEPTDLFDLPLDDSVPNTLNAIPRNNISSEEEIITPNNLNSPSTTAVSVNNVSQEHFQVNNEEAEELIVTQKDMLNFRQ